MSCDGVFFWIGALLSGAAAVYVLRWLVRFFWLGYHTHKAMFPAGRGLDKDWYSELDHLRQRISVCERDINRPQAPIAPTAWEGKKGK